MRWGSPGRYLLGLLALGCASNPPTGAGSNRAPWCPATLPEAGTNCALEPDAPGVAYAACEYGTEPHCSTLANCALVNGGSAPTWTIVAPNPSCAGNAASCPASFDAGGVAECTIGTSCMYATGRCFCAACGSGGCQGNVCGTLDAGTGWGCVPWGEPGPGCPSTPLLLGTPCSTGPNVLCGSNSGAPAICANGYWSLASGGC